MRTSKKPRVYPLQQIGNQENTNLNNNAVDASPVLQNESTFIRWDMNIYILKICISKSLKNDLCKKININYSSLIINKIYLENTKKM